MPSDPNLIFLSYAKEDAGIATRVYFDLRNNGFKPWIDREDLLPGQRWRETIRHAIKASKRFLILLSPASLTKRGFVQKEIKHALDILDEFPIDQVFIVPVRLEPCEIIDERLADLHWIDIFPSYEKGFQKLLRSLPPELSSTAKAKKEGEHARSSIEKTRSDLYHEFLRTAEELMVNSQVFQKVSGEGDKVAAGVVFRENGAALEKLHGLLKRIRLLGSEAVFAPATIIYTDAVGWRFLSLKPELAGRLEEVTREYLTNHAPSFRLAAKQDIGVFSIGDQADGE